MNYLKEKDIITLKRVKAKVRALNHPLRQEILDILATNKNSLTVTEIYVRLRIEQSVASQHLAILRNAGFLIADRTGKFIYYSVDKTGIKEFLKKCEEL